MDIGVLACRFCTCPCLFKRTLSIWQRLCIFFDIKNLCLEVIKKNGKWLGSTRTISVTVLNIL